MKKLDKKQVPQFAALCVVTAGVFGYSVLRMVTPGSAAAGTRPRSAAVVTPAAQAAPTILAAKGAAVTSPPDATATAADPDTDDSAVPPPTQGMHDPFVVGYVDPKTAPAPAPAAPPVPPTLPAPTPSKLALPKMGQRIAGLPPAPVSASFALPLPLNRFPVRSREAILQAPPPAPALPMAPAAPAWTVTGVLQSDQEQVAILRSGEARRIVRTGDAVDSVYRVVDVTRSAVTLRHGATFYQLILGAAKPVPTRPISVRPISVRPAPVKAETRPVAAVPFAQAGRSLLKLTGGYLAATPTASLPAAFGHARDTKTAQVAMRLLDDQTPSQDDARARLELGMALYRSGRETEGRAQWQSVLTMDDFDAADEAGKLLDRCP